MEHMAAVVSICELTDIACSVVIYINTDRTPHLTIIYKKGNKIIQSARRGMTVFVVAQGERHK
jgi:hypothetical protein